MAANDRATALAARLESLSPLNVLARGYSLTRLDGMMQNILIVPLSFLGGVFYSVERLPAPWREISHANPIFYLVQAVRYGFLGYHETSIAHHTGTLLQPKSTRDHWWRAICFTCSARCMSDCRDWAGCCARGCRCPPAARMVSMARSCSRAVIWPGPAATRNRQIDAAGSLDVNCQITPTRPKHPAASSIQSGLSLVAKASHADNAVTRAAAQVRSEVSARIRPVAPISPIDNGTSAA